MAEKGVTRFIYFIQIKPEYYTYARNKMVLNSQVYILRFPRTNQNFNYYRVEIKSETARKISGKISKIDRFIHRRESLCKM